MPRKYYRHRRDHRWARRSSSDEDEIPMESIRVKMSIPLWMYVVAIIYMFGFPLLSPCVLKIKSMSFWEFLEGYTFYQVYNVYFVFWLVMGIIGMMFKSTPGSLRIDSDWLIGDQISVLFFILSVLSISWSSLVMLIEYYEVKKIPSIQFNTLECTYVFGVKNTTSY